jgi:hypothetical protein
MLYQVSPGNAFLELLSAYGLIEERIIDMALGLGGERLEYLDIHGMIAVESECTELLADARRSDQDKEFSADRVVGPHGSPSDILCVEALINPEDIREIVNWELPYPGLNESRLKVLAQDLGCLVFGEDELEEIGPQALGGEMDEWQVAEAIELQVVFHLILTVVAEAEGSDPIARENSRFNGFFAMEQISDGRWNVFIEYFDLLSIERSNHAKLEAVISEQCGLILRNEEVKRIFMHIEFDIAFGNGLHLLLKFLQACWCRDEDVCHGCAPNDGTPHRRFWTS